MARWAVETTYESGCIGLVIFSAEDREAANEYLDDMCIHHGHNHLANLKQLTDGASVEELKRLFPWYMRAST